MSGGYNVLYRHGRGKGEEGEEDGQIQFTTIRLNGGDMEEGESGSEREELGGAREDRKSLIQDEEEDEIDENGVARDYEVALKHVGFGLFHVILLAVNGVALLSDAVEVLSVAFILPILQREDEFGATDAQNAVLSSVIFIGMLFGSYCWGSFADVVGRRPVLLLSLTMNGVFGLVSAFSPHIGMFIVCRFISGIGVGGSLPIIFPYIAEFTRNKYRGPYLGAQAFFWTFGRLVSGGIAWIILPLSIQSTYVHSWRLYIAISAVPALIGALLYLLLPESPRFLLEKGQEQKAMKALRLAYWLNHLHRSRGQHFPVKSIRLESRHDNEKDGPKGKGVARRLAVFGGQVRQVLSQTVELFKRSLLRRTLLLHVIMFCLAFGSYGVTLWYPTYVREVTDAQEAKNFENFCHRKAHTDAVLQDYCGCKGAYFSGQHFTNVNLDNFQLTSSDFHNVTFTNVTFSDSLLADCTFTMCVLDSVKFELNSTFDHVDWNQTAFSGVNVSGLSVCNGSASNVEGSVVGSGEGESGELMRVLIGGNASCDDVEVECEERETSDTVYRDLFLVSGSAFPGNVVSAVAVYYLRRNYWMAISLFASTASVFVLYVVHSEVFVVVVLCIFSALSTPAWNDSSLLITELYPTHLRSTAMGVHLLFSRVGAIFGTNLFGLFIHVNPSIPILLVACVLLVGSIAALPLPKTTRKTLLQ